METVRFTIICSFGATAVFENVLVTEEAWQSGTSKINRKIHMRGAAFLYITIPYSFFLYFALYKASEIIAPAAMTAGTASHS